MIDFRFTGNEFDIFLAELSGRLRGIRSHADEWSSSCLFYNRCRSRRLFLLVERIDRLIRSENLNREDRVDSLETGGWGDCSMKTKRKRREIGIYFKRKFLVQSVCPLHLRAKVSRISTRQQRKRVTNQIDTMMSTRKNHVKTDSHAMIHTQTHNEQKPVDGDRMYRVSGFEYLSERERKINKRSKNSG